MGDGVVGDVVVVIGGGDVVVEVEVVGDGVIEDVVDVDNSDVFGA